MSRYKKFKDSGIDWIGAVPDHWEVKRLKNIVLNDVGGLWGDEPADDENDIIVLRVADFDRVSSRIIDNPDFTYRNIRASQLEGRLIKQGDILLEKSGGGEQQPVGKAVLFDKDFKAVTSNFINKIETLPSVNNHFALYLFDALYYNNINVRNIKQTTGIQNLDNTGFFGEKISLPPNNEQLIIAEYLDDQTQKIDQLITNKKAQAEKLKELRQIEINNAVTKGLKPRAEMKDSGIDWLGKIPKHWGVKRIKNLAKQIGEKSTEILEEDFLVALENIEGFTGRFIDTASEYENNGIKFQKNNLLYNKLRPYLNKVYLADRDGICVGDIIVIECLQQIYPPFLQFRMLSDAFCSLIMSSVYGAKMPRTSWQFISSINIGYPSIEEQIEIVEYLQKRTTATEKLIKNIEGQIEKLQELRKIKIYEAVTGKIKVNSYAETTA